MKDVVLGLVGVGRIGVMHANNIAALNGVLNPQGITVRLRLFELKHSGAWRLVRLAAHRTPARLGQPRLPAVIVARGEMEWTASG